MSPVSRMNSLSPTRRPPARQAAARPAPPPLRVVPRFQTLTPREKGRRSIELLGDALPAAGAGLWENRGEVAKGILAPYARPIETLKNANESVRESLKEDRLEALLTAVKQHGSLLVAWGLPVALVALPVTTGPVAALGMLGGAVFAAASASWVKNVVDASRAETKEAFEAQHRQLLSDTLEIVPNAVFMAAGRAIPTLGADDLLDDAVVRYGVADDLLQHVDDQLDDILRHADDHVDDALRLSRRSRSPQLDVTEMADHATGRADFDSHGGDREQR